MVPTVSAVKGLAQAMLSITFKIPIALWMHGLETPNIPNIKLNAQ